MADALERRLEVLSPLIEQVVSDPEFALRTVLTEASKRRRVSMDVSVGHAIGMVYGFVLGIDKALYGQGWILDYGEFAEITREFYEWAPQYSDGAREKYELSHDFFVALYQGMVQGVYLSGKYLGFIDLPETVYDQNPDARECLAFKEEAIGELSGALLMMENYIEAMERQVPYDVTIEEYPGSGDYLRNHTLGLPLKLKGKNFSDN